MGQAIVRLCAQTPGCAVVAAVTRSSPAQRVVDGVPHFAATEIGGAPAFDVAIDFSLPRGFDALLQACVSRGAALVSGTTGLSDTQRAAMNGAGSRIPVLWASNFSLGVAVLAELVQRAAAELTGWDCDVVEAHHSGKKDAPSGTALTLGEAAGCGGAQARYASLRAGDIVGEHTVQFTGPGERLELVHRAGSRDIFARGAIAAALRLQGRPAGVFSLRQVLFDTQDPGPGR